MTLWTSIRAIGSLLFSGRGSEPSFPCKSGYVSNKTCGEEDGHGEASSRDLSPLIWEAVEALRKEIAQLGNRVEALRGAIQYLLRERRERK